MRNEYNYKIIYWEQWHFWIFTITSEEGNVNETLLEEIRSAIPSADIVGIVNEYAQNFKWDKFFDLIK